MTEEEAKTKSCPWYFTNVSLQRDGEDDQLVSTNASSKCRASSCMMWRWGVDHLCEPPSKTDGYCGLAGKEIR